MHGGELPDPGVEGCLAYQHGISERARHALYHSSPGVRGDRTASL